MHRQPANNLEYGCMLFFGEFNFQKRIKKRLFSLKNTGLHSDALSTNTFNNLPCGPVHHDFCRKLTKRPNLQCPIGFEIRLKIDHFERGMSEQFPIAYDGIHMKLLNLEIFISNALTFFIVFCQFLCFHCCSGFGPWTPLPLGQGLTKPNLGFS